MTKHGIKFQNRVSELIKEGKMPKQIVEIAEKEGIKTATGRKVTTGAVSGFKYRLEKKLTKKRTRKLSYLTSANTTKSLVALIQAKPLKAIQEIGQSNLSEPTKLELIRFISVLGK